MTPEQLRRLFPIPVLSAGRQRIVKERHALMEKWGNIAKQYPKSSPEHESWKRRVHHFLDEIEGCIYLMGCNPLDHGRRRKESA